MKYFLTTASIVLIFLTSSAQKNITLTKEQLKDKIKGGWAGQTIGVTFGGPYEFVFSGSMIQDYQQLKWEDGYLKENMLNNAGLYDDLYMDLTFVDIFEKYGLNAPVDSFASAFAHAGYLLWHANQGARYNILNGIKAPGSGHWKYNPHAADIDYQIEADYAGLMSPGMPNTASAISDKIGHIMNYGDGWYGGVYMASMYSLAFTSNDINYVVTEALKSIPAKSTFYQCINDVIKWHQKYPGDWKQNWFEIEKKWSADISCSDGIFRPFNIEAKINAAYVVLGLLYGGGDYTKTLEIATRAGQDADCNPSSAAGILGTMIGYEKIPEYWKMGLKEIEDINFKYTDISLNKAYDLSFKHALLNIEANGGKTNGESISVPVQAIKPVQFEQSFPSMYPVYSKNLHRKPFTGLNFEFEGTGFLLSGEAARKYGIEKNYVFDVEIIVDGIKTETIKMPTDYITRRTDICWKYELPNKKHSVTVKVLNPHDDYELLSRSYFIFSDKPFVNGKK